MRRFYIQSAEATWAEGVEFPHGLCAVHPLSPVYRRQPLPIEHVQQFDSLDHVAAFYHELSEGLTTLVMLDD